MRGQLPGSPKPSPKKTEKSEPKEEFDELELLFDKEHTCPVCESVFTAKEVRAGKAQSDEMDLDLRPRFKNIDPIKYRVIECPCCGYADFSKTFSSVRDRERLMLREKRLKYETDAPSEGFVREYSDAHRYYKSAMRCCLIRGAKSSKRAYTALNAAWLLRGWREHIRSRGYSVSDESVMSMDEERKLLKYAWKNFRDAETKEDFPISGMGESTYDYFMAVLSYNLDQINDAGKYILRALQSRDLKPILRTKAEDVRDMIREKRHSMAEEG